MADFKVSDVKLGVLDAAGAQIDTVYYLWQGDHAIFRTTERVVIQYADDKDTADAQRSKLAPLNVVRGEINGLVDGWRKGTDVEKSKAKLFDRGVADALEYAFESDAAGALATLNAIKANVLAERTAVARSQYIVVAGIAVLVVAAITCYFASPLSWIAPFLKPLWAAGGFGGMGALFSIAMGIHSREIGTDLQARQNTVDASLRILIGALSAVILYLLLRAKFVPITINNTNISDICLPAGDCESHTPALAQIAGMAVSFLAGFSERWVGDMLTRLVQTVSANPLAGTAPAAAGAAPGAAPASPSGGGGKPANGAAAADQQLQAGPQDNADGCVADNPPDASEHTADVELPPATGGVAAGQA